MTPIKFTWPKLFLAVVVAVVVGLFALFQFTTFQIPRNLTHGKPAVTEEDYKLQIGGSGITRNNLDELNDIMKGKKQIGDGSVSATGEGADVDQ